MKKNFKKCKDYFEDFDSDYGVDEPSVSYIKLNGTELQYRGQEYIEK